MTQSYLLKQLLESSSGKNLIFEVLETIPDWYDLKSASKLNMCFYSDEEKYNELNDCLSELQNEVGIQAFKLGFDLALTLTGKEPVYKVLPDEIKKEFWN